MNGTLVSYPKTSGQRQINFPCQIARIRTSYSSRIPDASRVQIYSSHDAVEVLRSKWHRCRIEHVEEFKIIVLNRANKVLGVADISLGGVSGCVVDPKVVFQTALAANASSIVLSHNHPSGNLKPSEADLQITRKCKEAGKFLDLPILDHIILTKDGFFSFADEGVL